MGQKEIIFSLEDGLQELTGRLGYNFVEEYRNTFLIQNNVISGCCSPPEFYLYDKYTGKLKKSLGRIIFYSKDKSLPIIISITNSNYDTTSVMPIKTSLTIYNIDESKEYLLNLPLYEIDKVLEENKVLYPEYLFEEPTIDNSVITLVYQKLKTAQKESSGRISIDLRKY